MPCNYANYPPNWETEIRGGMSEAERAEASCKAEPGSILFD